jgi:hypothetical protein
MVAPTTTPELGPLEGSGHGVGPPMRRALVSAAVAGAMLLAAVLHFRAPAEVPHAVAAAVPTADVMPDRAALSSLRDIRAVAAGQARELRSGVRRCAARRGPARGTCATQSLAHAGAGAKLNGIVLRAIAARLPPGPCMRAAGRLAGLVSTIAGIAVDGARDAAWQPAAAWAAARAAARAGGRVIEARHAALPHHCVLIGPGLRA